MDSQSDIQARRTKLRAIIKLLAGLMFLAALWIGFSFVGTLEEPSPSTLQTQRISIAHIQPGKSDSIVWNNRPLLILHRTPEMLKALTEVQVAKLLDPLSEESRQPSSMRNNHRSADSALFVAIATGTDLGCPVSFLPANNEQFMGEIWTGGFTDSCRGSRYDLAGRVFSGQQAAENLEVPPYRIEGDSLVIGVD